MFKHSSVLVGVLLAVAASSAFGYAAPQTASSSSTKLGQCSHANAGKKGDDYKNAVSACMKGDNTPMKKTSQQKMADCSHAAKGKKGDDYKNAVSSCMKQP